MCQPSKNSKKEPCKNKCPGCKNKEKREAEKKQQQNSASLIPIQNL